MRKALLMLMLGFAASCCDSQAQEEETRPGKQENAVVAPTEVEPKAADVVQTPPKKDPEVVKVEPAVKPDEPAQPEVVANADGTAQVTEEEKPAPAEPPFDPTPYEGPAAEAAKVEAKADGKSHERQVVPFPEGTDPFVMLKGVEPPKLGPNDPRGDTLRLGPQIPPEKGEVQEIWPPKMELPDPPKVVVPDLKVVRHKPDEAVDLVAAVTATFNQPMVPLAALNELDQTKSPLAIEPKPEGRFVWMGTDTVAFEPKFRMPFATKYTATIAAGTTSSLGKALAQPYTFTFETPRPKVIGMAPWEGSSEVEVEPEIFLTFNCAVDPQTVLQNVKLKTGNWTVPLLLVDNPVPEPKPTGNPLTDAERAWDRSRTVYFKVKEPLKPGTDYRMVVDAKLTSTEGPLPLGTEWSFGFRTYDPLIIKKISCNYYENQKCYPGAPVTIEFNNSLKREKVDALLKVTPAVEDMTIRVWGNTVVLYGGFEPSATYTIEAKAGFKDVHKQVSKAGKSQKVSYQDAYPFLGLVRNGLVVLEAKEDTSYLMTSMNVGKVTVRMAPVSDKQLYDAYTKASGYWWDEKRNGDIFKGFSEVTSKTYDLSGNKNKYTRTDLPLGPSLGPKGYGLVFLEAKTRVPRGFMQFDDYTQRAMVQVTNLGLSVGMSERETVVLVTYLDSAKPAAGVSLKLRDSQGKAVSEGVTDASGMAKLASPAAKGSTGGPYILLAELDSDRAFLLLTGSGEGDYLSSYGYQAYINEQPNLKGQVYTERGLYRPADDIFVHVMARKETRGPKGDLSLLGPTERACSYVVSDPRGTEVSKGALNLSPFGTASFNFVTKKDAPLGYYNINMSCSLGALYGSFQVEEFRTPEFKTEVEWQLDGSNLLVYRDVQAKVSANYYFGSPMPNAQVEWRMTRSSSYYTPPGNYDFSFSDVDENQTWGGYGRYGYDEEGYYDRGGHRRYSGSDVHAATGQGTTTGDGTLVVPVKLDPANIKRAPVSFTFEAEVFDKNRQVIAGSATVIAHWAERYLGLAQDRYLVQAGETVEVSGIITRLDGSRLTDGEVTVDLMLTDWAPSETVGENGEVNYEYKYSETRVGGCTLKPTEIPGKCLLTVPKAGSYLIRGKTTDKGNRPVRAALHLYAAGDQGSSWVSRGENRIELITDKKDYQAGDKAKVLIQSPFKDATGFMYVAREGFVTVQPLAIAGGNVTIEVDLPEYYIPSVQVGVVLVRGRTEKPGVTKDDRGRPQHASARTSLSINRKAREIALQLKPASDGVAPGEVLHLELEAKDAKGAPVVANVALMVVDEGVLSLISYGTPMPLLNMYTGRAAGASTVDLRPMVVPRAKPKVELQAPADESEDKMVKEESAKGMGGARAMKMAEAMPAPAAPMAAMAMEGGAPGGKDAAGAPMFATRELFKSTAYFNGELKTDANGKLSVDIKMPDNLTEFRIMALAADEGVKFGSVDTQVKTRLPLMVRPALPRFLNFGDEAEAAVMVNNETGFDTDVLVKLVADNATLAEDAVKTVTVPNGDSREVRFKVKAGQPGPATFQFAAVSLTEQRRTDAAKVILPTLIPATSEAFATYGVVDKAIAQPLLPPKDALPDYGGLEVSLSSTAMTGLQDAMTYLFDYPYECTEQICSRILPIISLGDVIKDFKIGKVNSPEVAKKLVQDGIRDLMLHQRDDGGFGSWPDSKFSWMYLTAYALMTLDFAAQHGFTVDVRAMEQAITFLQNRLDHPHEWEEYAYETQVFSALVLTRLNKAPKAHLDRLYKIADGDKGSNFTKLPLYSRAWLMEALFRVDAKDARIKELYRQINNAAVEKASSIHFAEGVTEYAKLMMYSEDRTDAIILGTLLVTDPKDSMIDKIVRGLMRARVQGRWSNTQSNAYALMAMSEYYRIFESDTPNFEAGLWLGKVGLLGHSFKGRSMAIVKSMVPMKDLLQKEAGDLILGKKGPGRLYYRLGLKYAPKDLSLKAEDRGFMVERIYLPESDKSDNVRRGPNGEYIVKAGTNVRVKLRVVAPDVRYYVAVVDPMPAGFESVNENFATTAKTRPGGSSSDEWLTRGQHGYGWWWWYWDPWDYKEKRDDRVQLFQDRMYGGVFEYTYVARATTLGNFVVPPLRAEEMYEPETFGRSATERVIIEP